MVTWVSVRSTGTSSVTFPILQTLYTDIHIKGCPSFGHRDCDVTQPSFTVPTQPPGSVLSNMTANHVQIQTEWNITEQQQAHPDHAVVLSWIPAARRSTLWKLRGAFSYLTWSQFSRLTVSNGLLVRCTLSSHGTDQVVVPTSHIPDILRHIHGHPAADHNGLVKSLDRAQRSFYWSYMSSGISKHCIQCVACQSWRSPVPRPEAQSKVTCCGAGADPVACGTSAV